MSETNTRARSLVDVLSDHAHARPQVPAYTYLEDGEVPGASLTYAELDEQARIVGATLQQLSEPGDRVLLLYPPGLDFVVGFLACQYAGVIAVPALPPNMRRVETTMARLARIIEDAGPTLALTRSDLIARLRAATHRVAGFAGLRWQASDRLDPRRAALWRPPSLDPHRDLSFLQYTSGSTSTPKGVMVSHQNLIANLEMLRVVTGTPEGESINVVSWLPQFHDLGLIGNLLYGLYTGGEVRMMAPEAFIKGPIRWLRAIAAHTNSVSGGPNFAFDLCLHRIRDAELEGLDLSSWSVAFCGAETVRPQTMARFSERFARFGLRPEALTPCYGLAEATLAVTSKPAGSPYRVRRGDQAALERGQDKPARPEAPALELVSCGTPKLQTLAIVDPDTRARRAEGQIGEIWVRGANVARGYWGAPELSAATFTARIEGEHGAGPHLRTGDLGFIRGGELFVTGRLKEIIIVRGRCLYPQDLELAVDALAARFPEIAINGSFAFALPGDANEGLGLIVKIREAPDAGLCAAIQAALREQFDLACDQIALVRSSPPKTSSGKKMRTACREMMLRGELDGLDLEYLHCAAPRGPAASVAAVAGDHLPGTTELSRFVLDWIAQQAQLDASELSSEQALSDFGLDSIMAVTLLDTLERHLGAALSSTMLEEAKTVDELSHRILASLPACEATLRGRDVSS